MNLWSDVKMLAKLMENSILFYGIILGACILVFLVVFLIVNLIKKHIERKKLKNTSEIILNNHHEEPKLESLEEEITKLEEKAKQKEEPLIEERESENLIQNQFIKSEPIQIEINNDLVKEENTHTDFESILSKMQEDLTKRDEKQILEFEQDQEENAIISYQELLKANGKEISKDETKFDLNDFFEELVDKTKKSYNLSDINKTGDLSIITIDDDMEEQNNFESNFDIQKPVEEINNINSESSTPMLEHIDIDKKNKKDKKFKVSEFISPIYGRIETKLDYPTIPSEDKSQKSISELKDDEFLNALKAFRQNL
jgi:hypothetical protein